MKKINVAKKFNLRSKLAAASAVAMTAAMTGPAFAGELAEAATSGMDKSELMLIGVAVLAVSGVIFLIRAGRKTAGG